MLKVFQNIFDACPSRSPYENDSRVSRRVGSTEALEGRRRRSGSPQTWRTFVDNHLTDIVAIDFFTVPAATFRILFAFVVLRHDRRHVVHFNVTSHPTAEWTAQQIVEAFPDDTAPRFLIRDRDGIYGNVFQHRVKNMGIEQVVCAPRSPCKIRTASALAVRYGESVSIMASRSTSNMCYAFFDSTATTIYTLARTCPWIVTRRSSDRSNRSTAAELSRFRKSADCIIGTAAWPERTALRQQRSTPRHSPAQTLQETSVRFRRFLKTPLIAATHVSESAGS